MGIRHQSLPISAVQFHPESLLTLQGDVGMRMIANLLRNPHGILPEKAEIFDGDEATVQAA
jgi:anthranilate synthase